MFAQIFLKTYALKIADEKTVINIKIDNILSCIDMYHIIFL